MGQRHIWEDDSGVVIDPFSLTPLFSGFWAASRGRNFIKDEFLSDWLNFHGSANGYTKDDSGPNYIEDFDAMKFIFQKGNDFEEAVMNHIRTLSFVTGYSHGDPSIQSSVRRLEPVLDDVRRVRDVARRDCANRTYELMEAGVPIINSGVVINPENRTFGVPDLIVRDDVLAQLFDDVSSVNPLASGWTSDLPHDHYYRGVDVKWSTVAANVSNKGEYKLQLAIYDMALSRMQGLKDSSGQSIYSNEGYVLAKKITGQSAPINPFQKPAVADLSTQGTNVSGALNWLQTVSGSAASSWQPSNPLLLRSKNVKNERGYWSGAISSIEKDEKDLGLLYNIGPEKREKLHGIGITTYDDLNLPSALVPTAWKKSGPASTGCGIQIQLLGMSPGDTIPAAISAGGAPFSVNRVDMLANSSITDFYVDFESIGGVNREDWSNMQDIQTPDEFIYMIGCGYLDSTNGWTERIFTTHSLALSEEKRIIQEWIDWMNAVTTVNKRVYHWAPHEKNAFNKAIARHGGIWSAPNWIDLKHANHLGQGSGGNGGLWVRDNNQGLYDFSIKTVVKALNDTGKISLVWPASLGGRDAEIGGANLEIERARTGGSDFRNLLFDSTGKCLLEMLEEYNRVDFVAIYEILNYVRNNHL